MHNKSVFPALLSYSYNALSVGRTDGNHGYGTTAYDGAGRHKPEIVAPRDATSYATPLVAGSGMILKEAAVTKGATNGTHSEMLKAYLMAGATKDEFGGAWDRTSTRPLDTVYGAGELNVYRSYQILDGGEQTPGTIVAGTAWDYGTMLPEGEALYFFDSPAGMNELSVVLSWNRWADWNPAGDSPVFPDLNLELYSANAGTLSLLGLLDSSISTAENVEHVYATGLSAGSYAFRVYTDDTVFGSFSDWDYALAWYTDQIPIPEPATALLLVFFLAVASHRRSR